MGLVSWSAAHDTLVPRPVVLTLCVVIVRRRGVELAFQRLPGVVKTRVGYIGGKVDNPTYQQVCTGTTGHAEAVEVVFDPTVVSYAELLDVFWERHDPTTLNRQGNDRGTQYRRCVVERTVLILVCAIARLDAQSLVLLIVDVFAMCAGNSGIFTTNEAQAKLAEESRTAYNNNLISAVVTEITPATKFYPAEDYHQAYLQKGGQSADKGNMDKIRCYG